MGQSKGFLGGLATLVLISILFAAVACSGDSQLGSTTIQTTTTSRASTGSTAQTTTSTTPSVTISELDRQLADTANAAHSLAVALTQQQVPDNDPKFAIVFGLRARTQAFTCLKALQQGDLTLADSAMKDVYATLSLGEHLADGEIAEVLAAARAIVSSLGRPSDNPESASPLLDQFVAELGSLIEDARALTPSTTAG